MHDVVLPSNKKFGLFFAVVFLLLAIWFLIHNSPIWYLALAVSLIVILIAFLTPNLLSPFNRAWMQLGILLGKVVNPLVLGVIFFCIVTPVAIFAKIVGRDELRLKIKLNEESHWQPRAEDDKIISFKDQF